MNRRRSEERLDDLRATIADDLSALRRTLGGGVPRGLRAPFWDLGKDAGRLLHGSSSWVVGAVTGVIAGILVAGLRRRSG